MKPNSRRDCVQIAESLGGRAWNFKLDEDGLRTWDEAASSPAELGAIRGKTANPTLKA
jgi:hypothetical protein